MITDVKGMNVIVVDDITTSGISMDSARNRLIEAGAKHVVCIAIGKTVK